MGIFSVDKKILLELKRRVNGVDEEIEEDDDKPTDYSITNNEDEGEDDNQESEDNEPVTDDNQESEDNEPTTDDNQEDDNNEPEVDQPTTYSMNNNEDETSEDNDNEPATDDNQEDDNETDEPTDYSMNNNGDDETSKNDNQEDDNETDEPTDYSIDDADDPNNEDDETGTNVQDNENDDTADMSEDNGNNNLSEEELKNLEIELFKGLSEKEISVKNKELKTLFLNLYNTINNVSSRLLKIPKKDETVNIINFCVNKIEELRKLLFTYLSETFDTKSYVQNMITYQEFLATLNTINKLLEEIVPKKAKND